MILGTDFRGFIEKDTASLTGKSCVPLNEGRVRSASPLGSSKNLCQRIVAAADEIIGEGLRVLNEAAEDSLTATQVAKTFNMTVFDFNAVLRDMGIQYRRHGRWNISDDLADRNLVRLRTHISYSLKGEKKVKHYMTWTLDGLRFLNSKLGYPNF